MSNSNFPKQPTDDSDDWGKVGAKHSAQPPADDWGNTVANVRHEDIDFNKTYMPGAGSQPNDWGSTQGNIKLPQDANYGGQDSGGPLWALRASQRLSVLSAIR